MDRLFGTKQHKAMTTIPVLDVQKKLDENYQDQIENLHLELLERDDAIQREKEQNTHLRQNITGLQANIAFHTTLMNDRNVAVARCTSMESQVKQLEADLKTEIGNRDHFRTLVAQQDAFIKEAKRQIERSKVKRDAELKSKTGEAEHLAKQAIRLNEDVAKLRTQIEEMTARNDETPAIMEENRKFKEQTTRLIEEKRVLEEELLDQRSSRWNSMDDSPSGITNWTTSVKSASNDGS